MILGFAKRKLRHLRNLLDGPGREFGVRVDSRAYCRAAQSKLLQTAGSSPDTLDAELDLASIAAEFLAQANRSRVGEVRAADLHDPVKLFSLCGERLVQSLKRREQFPLDRFKRGDVNRRRNHVIARLAHVDVVVRMDSLAASLFAENFQGSVGDNFVGVHVGGSPGSGLENIHDEFLI